MISVVIPVFNERESLPQLLAELDAVANDAQLNLEIIFVDDGSTDGSWQVIESLAQRHHHVSALRFRRNFGKAAALSAGFKAAHGERIFTLDADLQDNPREIPSFIAELDKGFDIVSGWKKQRHDPWHKVWPSRIFNWLVSHLTGVPLHDHNCGMKAYRASVFREVRLYGELHRFIPVLAAARGFKVSEVVIEHRPRLYGQSKYGIRRFVKGFLDLLTVKFLTGFGQRPQHLMGSIGLASFGLGFLGLIYLGITWLINLLASEPKPFLPLHQRPLLIYAVAALLLGAQMVTMGFLAELITAYLGREDDSYSVAEEIRGLPGQVAEGRPRDGGLPNIPRREITGSGSGIIT